MKRSRLLPVACLSISVFSIATMLGCLGATADTTSQDGSGTGSQTGSAAPGTTASKGKGAGRPQATTCEADVECRVDGDCAASAVCGCKVGDRGQNVCLTQSACKVDSDCASGERCNLSLPFIYGNTDAGRYGGVQSGSDVGGFSHNEALGYFCTTPADECTPGEPTGGIGDCVLSITNGRWMLGSKP